MKLYENTFLGNEVSEYGLEHKRVDYHCLAKSFAHILNNLIFEEFYGDWEVVNGADYYYQDNEGIYYSDEEVSERERDLRELIEELEDELSTLIDEGKENTEEYKKIEEELGEANVNLEALEEQYFEDVYQFYIIGDEGYDILSRYTNEIVYYNEEIDMYLWGVTHCGTSWDYVLTNIEIDDEIRIRRRREIPVYFFILGLVWNPVGHLCCTGYLLKICLRIPQQEHFFRFKK